MRVRCLLPLLLVLFGAAPLRAADAVPADPLFSRHVVPVFSRLGCNAGSCHGAVKGQNGFRLSLFGADPAADHARLIREASGRRLNRFATDDSLLLLKGTGATPHEGGNRMAVGGPEYRIVRNWIAAGAKLDDPGRSSTTSTPRGSRGSRSNRRSKPPNSANGIVSR